MVLAMHLVA
jgi:hypothetical protein